MAKSLKKKIFSFLLLIVSGLIVGLIISTYLMLHLSVPVTDGEKKLNGITAPVEITFDEKGIPQIWAETETDAYFALGYQHAADRMFQMDLSRRIAQGKLSEMLGTVTESIDQFQKKIGHHRIAEKYLDSLSESTKANLDAYVKGINSYRQTCRSIPFEYRFLPVDFVEWTLKDCMALFSFQTWYSNSLMNRDSFYNKLTDKVGAEKAATLLFDFPQWSHATVESAQNHSTTNSKIDKPFGFTYPYHIDESDKDKVSPFQYAVAEKLFESSLPSLLTESSNCWVVAPQKSATGHAILASDPHLEISRLPQFWYAVGIHIRKTNTNAFGVTTPGLPFLVMGHNGQSAWAFTAGGNNLVDYTKLELNPENKIQYKTAIGWQDFETTRESVYTSATDTGIIIDVKQTEYGVIVDEDSTALTATAINWVGYQSKLNDALAHAFEMTQIKTYEQFQSIVTNVGAIDANYMYADINGNIGYQLASPVVRRENDNINLTHSYLTGVIEYQFYPKDSLAHAVNPDKGWLASSNNIPEWNSMYDGFYFADRIVSINELLNSKESFSISDMYTFQFDVKNRYLEKIQNLIIESLNNIDSTEIASSFASYDFSFDTSSHFAALTVVFLNKFKEFTFFDNIGELNQEIPDKWIEHLAQIDSAGWFDDRNTENVIESMLDISSRAIRSALEITNSKNWGDMHTLTMEHPMVVIPIVGSLLGLSTETEARGGAPGTLNASFYSKLSDSSYTSVAGASMRFVIDFSDPDAATIVLPAGNSGNPMSDHFMDFNESWKTNGRWNVPLSKDKVYAKAVSTLKLIPQE